MRIVLLLLLIGGLSLSEVASAQQPCAGAEYRQFDFWLGEWEVFDYTNAVKGSQVGTNRIEKILGGCALQENWRASDGSTGNSYNSYFNLDKKWHQSWVDSSGYRLEIAGVFKDGKMVLEGSHPGQREGVTLTNRITWGQVDNSPDQVRQTWEVSRDGGKSWSVSFDGLYLRKK